MKKLCLVSGSRAEYGQFKPLLMRLQMEKDIEINFVVTGTHLNSEFGNTQEEINKDPIIVAKNAKIPLSLYGDSKKDMAISTGEAITHFAEYFEINRPDLLVLIGDRFEIFAVSVAAALQLIPIAHICGGSTTLGAVDEFFRHSITKMSYLHFTTCETYRKRVIQLGEFPERIFNVGGLGVAAIKKKKLLSKKELMTNTDIQFGDKNLLVTYHPVSLEKETSIMKLKIYQRVKDIKKKLIFM